jgi:hypothetical protein
VGKPEGKRPFERPRCKWKDNIEVNLWLGGLRAWTGSICFRILTGGGCCECGNESYDSINFLSSWGPFSISGRTLLNGVRELVSGIEVTQTAHCYLLLTFQKSGQRIVGSVRQF